MSFKDISKDLVKAVHGIMAASRDKYQQEAADVAARKKPMPGMKPVPQGKADEPVAAGAKTAHKTVAESKFDYDKNGKLDKHEKDHKAEAAKIKKLEKDEKEDMDEGWDDMLKAAKERKDDQDRKTTTKTGHDVKKTSTGTVYTKKYDKKSGLSEEEVAESLTSKAQKMVKMTGDVAGAIGTIAGGVVGGTAKTAGAARQALPATKDAYMKGRMAAQKAVAENTDTPGNATHQCAVHVKSEQFGEGRTLTSQHAEPDAEGQIAWYDVMFDEGIKRVETKDLEILVSESHMSHKKKGK